MKFITEADLRNLYQLEPFTAYHLEPDVRFTPGARQFLRDHRIHMIENNSDNRKKTVNKKEPAELTESKNNWKNMKLYSKMKSLEALFLITEGELLQRDVGLAQSVIFLRKQFHCIKNVAKSKDSGSVDNLCCHECTGIKKDNFSDTLEDCFEITEFHMQLEKGKEIIILHKLRCALQEIEPVVLEFYESSDDDESTLCKFIISKINQIINSLSQLICSAFGGEKCQKQS